MSFSASPRFVLVLGVLALAASADAYTCTNTVAPNITFIDSASAYGGYSYFGPGSYLEIKGSNLADPNDPRIASGSGQWAISDFNGAAAPTNLDGISATIDGKPAYISYISPGQINVQAPQDSGSGFIMVTVTNCHATSSAIAFTEKSLAPGLLAPPNYSANGEQYLVATIVSDTSEIAYVLNTSTGASFGLNSRPAKPGDTIIAYGVGFGPVSPSVAPGNIVAVNNALANPVTISFGSTQASVSYAGLAPDFVGLYEFYITVPQLPAGDYPIIVTQNGIQLPQPTYYLTVGGASTPTAQLENLTLSSSSVTGGTGTTGTVTLSAAAPAGGVVVSLASNSTAVGVPSSVTVPSGATSANFNVTTSSVNSNTNASITATYGGVSISAALSVLKGSSSGGGGTVSFDLLTVTPNITSTNTSNLTFSFSAGGAGCVATGNDLSTNAQGFTFGAVWSSYTQSGNTITCTGLQVSNTSNMMTYTTGQTAHWTSATLTFTLIPQGSFSGTVTNGTLQLTSSLATVNASFTGTYETE